MIDAHNGDAHSVDTLVKMKRRHEEHQGRKDRITSTIRLYIGNQYEIDDRVLFEQVDLHGPSVDAMFVDVPFACSPDTAIAEVIERIAAEHPGDPEALAAAGEGVVARAAQALLHADWRGNALQVGGPGQGKSTLLQYVCQFHRSRMLGKDSYTGDEQQLPQVRPTTRVAIRLDLRRYAHWAIAKAPAVKDKKGKPAAGPVWRSIEQYIVAEVKKGSGGHEFSLEDLAALLSTEPVLLALDGLDEVANIDQRLHVSDEIVEMHARLKVDARDLVAIVATRPGATTSRLWSSRDFPRFTLQRLSQGLRIQYLRKWSVVAGLSEEAADKLQATFMDNQHVPHIRELASYPMQLAILLHLLYRRQLLPQQRTELYAEYLKTFLDREQTAEKEPLLADQRATIVSVHAYLGWYLQTRAEEGAGAGSISRIELRRVLRDHLEGQEYGTTSKRPSPPYSYSPITERDPITWPGGSRVAVYIGLNVEHFLPGQPSTSIWPGTAELTPDALNHGWRDYGARVGIWRTIESLDEHGIRPSVLLNSMVAEQYPQIVSAGVERDWAWLAHGRTNSTLHTGLTPEHERQILTEVTDTIRNATGHAPRGWMGPGLTETHQTPDILADLGYQYVLDWTHDDQPYPLTVPGMISVPYTVELNDRLLFAKGFTGPDFLQMVTDTYEQLHADSTTSGRVMAIALHPFVIGQPSRHKYLDQALAYLATQPDAWLTTSDDIAAHYLEQR